MLMFYKAQQVILGLFDKCRYNRYGLVIPYFGQHNKVRMAFYEGNDMGIFRALNQVAFLVPGYTSVCNLRGSCAYGSIRDFP